MDITDSVYLAGGELIITSITLLTEDASEFTEALFTIEVGFVCEEEVAFLEAEIDPSISIERNGAHVFVRLMACEGARALRAARDSLMEARAWHTIGEYLIQSCRAMFIEFEQRRDSTSGSPTTSGLNGA